MTSPSSAKRSAEQIDQGLARTVLIGQTLGCGMAVLRWAGGGQNGYPGWFIGAVLTILMASTGASYVLHYQRSAIVRPLQIFVMTCTVAMVSQVWVWQASASELAVPPLDNALGVGMGLASIAFGWAPALGVIAAFSASYLAILPPTMGWLEAVGFVATTGLAGAACVAARSIIDHARRDLDRVDGVLQATKDFRQIGQRRHLALVDWHDVLHGKIIGSFLAAGSGAASHDTSNVQQLANEALAVLSGITPTPKPFAEFVQHVAECNALLLTSHVEGDWVAEGPVSAFRSAVTEALVNVARHSGQQAASVTARFRQDLWQVTVEDTGVGFDVQALGAHRGLQVSLMDPIEMIGGTHSIRSEPGQGATVVLSWARPSRLAAPQTPVGVRWLVIIAFVSLGIHVVVGWALRGKSENPSVILAGGLIMLVLLGLAVADRRPSVLVASMIAVQLLLAANLPAPGQDLWTFWFAGAMSGFSGALAYRGSIRWSVCAVAASWLGVVSVVALRSGQPFGTLAAHLAGLYTGPLVTIVASVIGWSITLSHRALQQQVSEREAALQESADVIRTTKEWADEYGDLIGRVTPTLERLAQAIAIPQQLREDCRVLEAECRDYLEAPTLLTPAITSAIERARRRGARIRLSGTQQAPDQVLATIQALLLIALRADSLRELTMTHSADHVSLLIRANPDDIPLPALARVARLDDVKELPDGRLARFAHEV